VLGNSSFQELLESDPRYPIDAYEFLMDALNYTITRIGERRHVSGGELLDGIRDYARDSFGPMALHVLHNWSITRTDHFGDLVFNMVTHGMLAKTEDDSQDDFSGVYSFEEAFGEPDVPSLDEFGHVPRKLPHDDADDITWASFFGDSGMN
jgi:uncharacterized repeat protein (TIGR04138 family)